MDMESDMCDSDMFSQEIFCFQNFIHLPLQETLQKKLTLE
jgi:hypothetical protein